MRLKATFLTAVLLFALGNLAISQSYYYLPKTGYEAAYVWNSSSAADILSGVNDVLSSPTNIGFSWNFYGTAVTQFKASDNGYITFDLSATISSPANSSIPTPGAPEAAIYAFWDAIEISPLTGAGSVDKVKTWMYGTTPNRVRVIQWYSATPEGTTPSSNNFLYVAIMLKEAGDFDIVLGGAGPSLGSPMSGTIGIENGLGTDGNMVSGSPTITYPTGLSFTDNTDDVVYSFYYGTQPNFDLSVVTETGLGATIASGANNTITGSIQNLGATMITSFDMHYTVDGGGQVDQTVSSANIAPSGGSYTYSFSTPLNSTASGTTLTIAVWADNLNGSNIDEKTSNDILSKDVIVTLGIKTSRNVLLEEWTGAWCGYCPDGSLRVEQMETQYGEEFIGVAFHQGDDMQIGAFANYDARFTNTYGYPGGMVDRVLNPGETILPHGRSTWAAEVASQLTRQAVADMDVTATYNSTTRVIDATVTANFVDYAMGDMRLNLYVIEDEVTGTGNGYDQTNYYSSAGSAVGGPSHYYYPFPDPIVGFEHNHVIREIQPDVNGTSGVIPASAVPGTPYSQTYSYTLPGNYDENKVHLVGFASYYHATDLTKNEIINAKEIQLIASGIEEPSPVTSLEVIPNPARGITVINFSLEKMSQVEISLYNVVGQKVKTLVSSKMIAGQHHTGLDAGSLDEGIYFITIKTGGQQRTVKLVVLN